MLRALLRPGSSHFAYTHTHTNTQSLVQADEMNSLTQVIHIQGVFFFLVICCLLSLLWQERGKKARATGRQQFLMKNRHLQNNRPVQNTKRKRLSVTNFDRLAWQQQQVNASESALVTSARVCSLRFPVEFNHRITQLKRKKFYNFFIIISRLANVASQSVK